MTNVIEFKKPEKTTAFSTSAHMFNLNMYETPEGELEVSIEISEGFDDEQVFEAMVAAAMKFAMDTGLNEPEIELVDEDDG